MLAQGHAGPLVRPIPGKTRVHDRIVAQSARWPSTQLGIGVVSRTVVDAAIEAANEYDVDLMLIASRRQVDMDSLGGGYVCGWNAGRLQAYVRERDRGDRILLCRDHGGPWQNSVEIARNLSPAEAMASAKESYAEDIAAGFDVLHIDTSVTPEGTCPAAVGLDRLFDLYTFCQDLASKLGRDIAFEIGTEEQDSISHSIADITAQLESVTDFCKRTGYPKPTFIVGQTGTKVLETRNVGMLGSPYRVEGALPTEIFIPRLASALNRFGVMLKQHNTDYLSDEVLRWHPELGIHAANVAPEFGVAETRALVHVLEANSQKAYRDRFLELAYACRKWEKWMLPNTTATDRERAIIAGHYVFSTPAFLDLQTGITRDLAVIGIDLERYLVRQVKRSILRYLAAFRLRRTQ